MAAIEGVHKGTKCSKTAGFLFFGPLNFEEVLDEMEIHGLQDVQIGELSQTSPVFVFTN